jgi:CubicO group peptidase (beta-lactamase class C family)
MPSAKSRSPRAAARAAERSAAAAAAAAAELKAISKLSAQEMLVSGFGVELGDTDEGTRENGVKKMLFWLKSQKDVSEMNMQKMSVPFSPIPSNPKP